MPITTEYPPLTATQRGEVRSHAAEARSRIEEIRRLLKAPSGGADDSSVELSLGREEHELAGMDALLAR